MDEKRFEEAVKLRGRYDWRPAATNPISQSHHFTQDQDISLMLLPVDIKLQTAAILETPPDLF